MATSAPRGIHVTTPLICQWSQRLINRSSSPLFHCFRLQGSSQVNALSRQPRPQRSYATKHKVKRAVKPTSTPARIHPGPKKQLSTSPRRIPPVQAQAPLASEYPIPPNNQYARYLAEKRSPTVLYLSNKSDVGPFLMASISGFLGSLAITNTHWLFTLPELWSATPWLALPYNLAYLGIAAFLFIRSMRPVRSIEAQPVTGGLKLVIGGGQGPTLPLTNIRLWAAETESCAVTQLNSVLPPMQSDLPRTPEERRELLLKEEDETCRIRDSTYFLLRPFRSFFSSLVAGFKDYWLERKIIKIFVARPADTHEGRASNGPTWRLDVKKSWMLEEGSALNKVCFDNPGWQQNTTKTSGLYTSRRANR